MLSEIQDRSRSGTEPCCTANCETAGETAAVAACRSHGRSVTCRDFWRFRCRFPTIARDRPLAIVRLSQHGSVPPSRRCRVEIRHVTAEGLRPFAKKTLGAGRARVSRKNVPEAPKSARGDVAVQSHRAVGPRANDRQAAGGTFFRPADWVFDREWPQAFTWSANFREA